MSDQELIESMKAARPGGMQILPQGEYVPPQSALVHIHEDLYMDAARVVSVEACNFEGNDPFVRVVSIHEGSCDGLEMHRFVMPFPAAQQLAREIMERVNRGRFPMLMHVGVDTDAHGVTDYSAWQHVQFAAPEGWTIAATAQEMSQKLHDAEQCTCPTSDLMACGCKCGAVKKG